jgi:predicted Rossmann-fold nucleotide-binding protein
MPRRPIIGVIGGNRVLPEVLGKAKAIGHAVARNGAILLTGGRPTAERDEVKAAAMVGALQDNRAAIICVLPKGKKDLENELHRTTKHMFIQTTLTSGQRNPINAMTSDSLFVLEGGSGTLAELGFALMEEKPVHFAGSFGALGDTLKNGKQDIIRKIDEGIAKYVEFTERQVTSTDVLARLDDLFCHEQPRIEVNFNNQSSVDEFVRTALKWLHHEFLELDSKFPGVTGVLSKPEFELWLKKVSQ